MDLDDFDKPSQPARTSMFQPKSRKKQPVKSEAKVEPPSTAPETASAAAVVVTVKKEVEVQPEVAVVEKMDEDEVVSTVAYGGGGLELKEEKKMVSTFDEFSLKIDGCAMEEEDYVVAEYDVYYTPPSSDSQLYVMQYPLRPSWRPYELEQRCTEVRMRPSTSEMEVDLTIDKESDNYDRDSPLADKMQKQTLSSPGKSPQAATYAVGLLKGKKLYLNPIHAVVQLRPSMEYLDLDSRDLKKKSANPTVKGEQKQSQNEEVEPWIRLNYHSPASDLAQMYLRKMVTEENNSLQFSMNPYDYLNSLCPGAVINNTESNGFSRSFLLSLPLEDRLKKLLVEGPHLQRFNAIMHVAPDVPAEDVLKIVQQHANLVQGVWVSKSSDRCKSGLDKMIRDYVLFLFTQNPIMKDSELDILGHRKNVARTELRNIAVERTHCKDWKFVEPTDVLFINRYPDIVEQQWTTWQAHGKNILEIFTQRAHNLKRQGPSVPSIEGLGKSTHEARSVSKSMSKEAREALSKVLGKLFLTHKVCSLQAILQGLRDTAVSMSVLPKVGAKNSAVMAAVKNAVDAPPQELQAIISEYASNVHGLYVVKSSSEQPQLNPLRNDIIDLFSKKEPGAALRKGEIMEASKNKPATSEFQKVINEYCVSKGGAWVLKSGDGISSNDWQSIFKAAKLL